MFIRDCEHYGEKWTGEPIPLTEDILLRLGFTDKGSNRFSFDRLDVYTKNASDAYEVQLWNFDGNISWVQYVHELQNIVFRLPKKDKLIFTKKTKKKREKMGDVLREFIRQYISQD